MENDVEVGTEASESTNSLSVNTEPKIFITDIENMSNKAKVSFVEKSFQTTSCAQISIKVYSPKQKAIQIELLRNSLVDCLSLDEPFACITLC